MRARALSLLRSFRAARERAFQLTPADATGKGVISSPPLPPPASLPSGASWANALRARMRGLVLSGPGGWHPASHLATSWTSASGVRALGGPLAQRFSAVAQRAPTIFECIGESTIILRDGAAELITSAIRRAGARQAIIRNGPRMLHAAGMGLTAAITREDRDATTIPSSVLRLLSSTKGPQQIGIGWLSHDVRALSAIALYHSAIVFSAYLVWMAPAYLPWIAIFAVVAYATRPNLGSFRAYIRERAPEVARKKTEIIDRVRARLAPYMLEVGSAPEVNDYGFFSIVSVRDYADYVYVYLGVFSRWILLGWYRAEFDFDRIKAGK